MFKILIVDDEHLILNGIKLMIEELLSFPFVIQVSTANSGKEALSTVEKLQPDLVLTDIRMPVMDGFQLIAKLKENDYPGTVMILTSHADFEYARSALRFGVKEFLLKPIDTEALRLLIISAYNEKEDTLRAALQQNLTRILSLILYGIPAADLLLTEDTLSELFPLKYITLTVIETEGNQPASSAVKELFNNYYSLCYSYSLCEKNEIIIICCHDDFRIQTSGLKESLYQLFHCDFYLGTSMTSTSSDKLHEMYNNACQRIFYHKAFGNNNRLVETASFSYQECVNILLEPDKEMALKKIENLLDNLLLVENPNPEYLGQIYTSMRYNLSLYLFNIGVHMEQHPEVDQFFYNRNSLSQCMQKLINGTKEALKINDSKTSSRAQISPSIDYIKAHCTEDISLDDISEAVGLTPKYICTLFKKHTGDSYLTWLHKERIQLAKTLLEQNKQTIEEVAHSIGYNSSTQFGRVFKKYEGRSPHEYRDALR